MSTSYRHPRKSPPTIVAYTTDRFTNPADAVQIAVRAQGCTCDPEIVIDGIGARVAHDAWCALLRKGDVN